MILLDNEFCSSQEDDLLEFCRDADLMVWDGMFTEEELKSKTGWGHSTIEQAERFADLSSVKRTLICHHAPNRSDKDIDKLKSKISTSNVDFGYERMSIVV